MEQLLSAMKHYNAYGIIHRDIKPENIMVGADGEVSLIDWGIAQNMGVDDEDILVGTPLYMSPEQSEFESLDQRTDIYSISAVLYELLSLRKTITPQHDVFAVLRSIRTSDIPCVDDIPHPTQGYVPSEFKSIVNKGLARNKDDRYGNTEEMLLELIAVRNGEFCSICPRTLIKRTVHNFMHWMFNLIEMFRLR